MQCKGWFMKRCRPIAQKQTSLKPHVTVDHYNEKPGYGSGWGYTHEAMGLNPLSGPSSDQPKAEPGAPDGTDGTDGTDDWNIAGPIQIPDADVSRTRPTRSSGRLTSQPSSHSVAGISLSEEELEKLARWGAMPSGGARSRRNKRRKPKPHLSRKKLRKHSRPRATRRSKARRHRTRR